jgi:hypothetical protein
VIRARVEARGARESAITPTGGCDTQKLDVHIFQARCVCQGERDQPDS